MYIAKNGFTLRDSTAPGGWPIRSAKDIELALYTYSYFQTVAAAFLWEAIAQAVDNRKEYADFKEFANHVAEYV